MCDVLRKRKAGKNTPAHLVEAPERDIARDLALIGRYNVAPGQKVYPQ